MNEYIVSAVITVHDKHILEETIREVIKNILGGYEPSKAKSKSNGLPDEAIDFLNSL